MSADQRAAHSHRWCDLEMHRLQKALDVESRHNAVLAIENARLSTEAAQAEREREEALVEVTRLLNLLVAQAVTEAARVLPVVVS